MMADTSEALRKLDQIRVALSAIPEATDNLARVAAEANEESAATNAANLLRIEKANERIRWLLRGLVVLVVIVLVLLGSIFWNSIQNRKVIKSTSDATESIQEATDRIRDCTDPSGACFQRGQDAQKNAISEIVRQVDENATAADDRLVHELECVMAGGTADDCIAKSVP